MAASTYNIQLSNGQTLSVYQAASQAVNSNPVVSMTGPAASTTTTTDFTVMSTASIVDVVVAAALTAGGFEVYNVTKGIRSGKGLFSLEGYLITNVNRQPPRITFVPGNVYRLIQTTAGNA